MGGLRDVDFGDYIHAADAVATLAFGVVGSLVGLLAFRAAGGDGDKGGRG
jgi:hypothetical protein